MEIWWFPVEHVWKRNIEMKNKLRCGPVIGSTGLGMKTTINKSLPLKTIAISTHALHRVTSAMTKLCKKTCSQEHLSHAGAVQWQNICNKHNYSSICSKANRKDDKEEAVPCDDEESVYLIIRIRLHILWYSKMHCRRGERWHNGEQGSYSERGGGNKIQGMKMEQQKQQKASEKIYEINKNKQQNNKSKRKTITVSCDQSTPQQTNEKCLFFFAQFSCTHSEPGNRTKHDVHVCLQMYVVGSYDWHRLQH